MAGKARIVAAVGVAVGRWGAKADPAATFTRAALKKASAGFSVSAGGKKGHKTAYGTPEEIQERYATYARQFWALVEKGKPKEKAYKRVAKFHGISDGPVRTAVRKNKRV